MPTDHILALLLAERDKLNHAIEALKGTKVEASAPKKRHMSAATRRKMALGQKRRYAALKAAK
jgi:hypothetical protein